MAQSPTLNQLKKIEEITIQGYRYDKVRSLCANGVVFSNNTDSYFFGFDGSIIVLSDIEELVIII
jgi:hypothetical protein